jgi:hypothetical protein
VSKYGNKKTVSGGERFDSQAEARRYGVLLSLQAHGAITHLKRQAAYVLAPSVKINGEKRARPALRYLADFEYVENGVLIVEDTKSPATAKLATFRAKQHLMATVHGIHIRITK